MIKLILGHKGSGKTKKLIALVNEAMEASNGSVACVEKEALLTTEISHKVRLIDTDSYGVEGYDQLLGFLCGVCAGNHDITDLFVDATLKIGGKDYAKVGEFLTKVNGAVSSDVKVTFTVSADKEELPAAIFDFCEVI